MITIVLLFSLYSGQLYFWVIGVFLVALISPKRVRGVMSLLAVCLAAVSGPLPGAIVMIIALVMSNIGERRFAAFLCAGAIAIEAPYHVAWRSLPAPSRIFVIGDSLSSGGFGETDAWPVILGRRLRVPVTNLSLASADAAMAVERQLPELPPPSDSRELLLIEIGGNDMLDGVAAKTFAANLDRVLAADRNKAMLELPLLPGRWSYGAIQRRLARKHGCRLIPKRVLARVLTREGNTFDGVHLTQAGHDELAATIARYFE